MESNLDEQPEGFKGYAEKMFYFSFSVRSIYNVSGGIDLYGLTLFLTKDHSSVEVLKLHVQTPGYSDQAIEMSNRGRQQKYRTFRLEGIEWNRVSKFYHGHVFFDVWNVYFTNAL